MTQQHDKTVGAGHNAAVSRVLVITNNLNQASFRLRVAALRDGLRERGVELETQVRPRSWGARRRLLRTAGEFDAVLLQRKMLEKSDMTILRRAARKIYFDVDDAVMFHSRPVGFFERWRTRRRFLATARNVDRVVAGNDYLAELFRDRGAAASVLPTMVDPGHYRVKEDGDGNALVWIGSKSTLPYLRGASEGLAEAGRRVAGLRAIVIADVTWPDAPLPVEHVAWAVESEAEGLLRGDIGIAPTPDDPWTAGKCGFKIVQYMAAGLPVVASPVGANAKIVAAGETGFLPGTAGEWADAIAQLAGDAELRKRMGAAGRQRVEKMFSLPLAVEFWAKLLS